MLRKLSALIGAALALAVFFVSPASAAPVRAQSISNLVGTDKVVSRCDATGHCGRLHIVVQAQDGIQIRGFASVQCYSASGDFNCASIQGNTWLDDLTTGGSFNGPIVTCTSCNANAITPWAVLPIQSHNWQQGAAFTVLTGAVGGNPFGLSTAGPEFHV